MAWAPAYTDLVNLKSFLRIDDAADDVTLSLAIEAASRAVDEHCGRQFGVVDATEERKYRAWFDIHRCRWVVDIDDLMDDSVFTVSTESGPITEHQLQPRNASQRDRPWTMLVLDRGADNLPITDQREVTVEALWGWTAVPQAIEQATLLQAARIFSRRTSPYGVAGSPDLGSELRLLARVDPDVAVVVEPFIRWWQAV